MEEIVFSLSLPVMGEICRKLLFLLTGAFDQHDPLASDDESDDFDLESGNCLHDMFA